MNHKDRGQKPLSLSPNPKQHTNKKKKRNMKMKQSKEKRLVKKLSRRPETKTPIATDLFIPNHSGDHSAGTTGTPVNDYDLVNKQYVDAINIWQKNGSDIYFNTGNVGIGTDSPTYQLHLIGTAKEEGIKSEMGIDLDVVSIPSAPTLSLITSTGNLGVGKYYYFVTYVTAIGETDRSNLTSITTTAGNQQVNVTIPVSTDHRVTGRKIFRTKVGDSAYKSYFLAEITDNTTTTYTDNTADADLTGSMKAGYYQSNSTNPQITINGVKSMLISNGQTNIGFRAGDSLTTGGESVYIGTDAGTTASESFKMVGVGNRAFQFITTSIKGVAIGYGAGQKTTTANYVTYIGHQSGYYQTTGSSNSAFGHLSLSGTSGQSASTSSAFGAWAGYKYYGITGTFFGYKSGYSNLNGNYITAVGAYAGYSILGVILFF